MSLLGNLIWLVFGGFLSGLGYIIAGLVLCVTIVGIPFGLRSMKMGLEVMMPFGKDIEELRDANSPLRLVFNVIWLLLFGWELALNHLFWALIFAITIVGLPFAFQHLKLVPLALIPFGRELRSS
ncbi:MAG: YccF domain-containing protein [Myxococcota bacterium]